MKAYPCLACDLVMLRGAPMVDPPAQCPTCGVDGRGAALAVDEVWRKGLEDFKQRTLDDPSFPTWADCLSDKSICSKPA